MSALTGWDVVRWGAVGALSSGSSEGISVSSGASAHTDSDWVELIAATEGPADWLQVDFRCVDFAQRSLIDVGIGPAGSEVVLIPDIYLDTALVAHGYEYAFPIHVPEGSRVAVRSRADAATRAFRIALILGSSSPRSPATCNTIEVLGAETADTSGIAIDPGGTINTKGSWVELGVTTFPWTWLVVAFGHNGTGVGASTDWLVDIGIGAAGSEVVLIPDAAVRAPSASDHPLPPTAGWPVVVPAGTRIAARCQCSVATATERLLDLVAYGAG